MTRKRGFNAAIVLLFLGVTNSARTACYFEEREQGWHWYVDPVFEPDVKEEQETQPPSSAAPSSPTELLNRYKKELERRLHAAWVSPTPKNLKAYQMMQKDLTERASLFSDRWMEVVYQNPALDFSTVVPTNQSARHIYFAEKKAASEQKVRELAESHGLFFFFSSHCAYCKQFAPIVQRFAEQYGWEVMAISLDGGTLDGFKTVREDNGFSTQLGVEVVPALFAVNPSTGKVLPIANGMSSFEEMENRIMTLSEGA